MRISNLLGAVRGSKLLVLIAPTPDLTEMLANLASQLEGSRVLGVLGDDALPLAPRDVAPDRPVLIGIPGITPADAAPYRKQLEVLAAKHGSCELVAVSLYDPGNSLTDYWRYPIPGG